MSVASEFGLSLSEVHQLELWQYRILIDALNERSKKTHPDPRGTPVMT